MEDLLASLSVDWMGASSASLLLIFIAWTKVTENNHRRRAVRCNGPLVELRRFRSHVEFTVRCRIEDREAIVECHESTMDLSFELGTQVAVLAVVPAGKSLQIEAATPLRVRGMLADGRLVRPLDWLLGLGALLLLVHSVFG